MPSAEVVLQSSSTGLEYSKSQRKREPPRRNIPPKAVPQHEGEFLSPRVQRAPSERVTTSAVTFLLA